MYVQPETLADKRRMLYLWDMKLQVQLDLGHFNEQSYKGFEAQEKAFKRADELFEKEADLCYSNIILRLIRARGRHRKSTKKSSCNWWIVI